MINTVETKRDQLKTGSFKTGSGKEVVLIMGSCRSMPYLNYLNTWNNQNGNRFTIHYIDPFNHHWNEADERVDYIQALERLETNQYLLGLLKSVKIFIHESYSNYGIFNSLDKKEKNIYQFGMNPELNITLPNFHDIFILFNDIATFDQAIKAKAKTDYDTIGELSEETQNEIYTISQNSLKKFYGICQKSDIPEMEDYFKNNFTKVRLFWTSNHIAKNFSLAIFGFMNDKFLKLKMADSYWDEISKEDQYANNYTFLSEYDVKHYGYEWKEEIKKFKDIL